MLPYSCFRLAIFSDSLDLHFTLNSRPLPYQPRHLSWWPEHYFRSILLNRRTPSHIKIFRKPAEENLCRTLLLIIETSNDSVWQKPFKSATPLHSLPRLLKVGRQLLTRYLHNGFPFVAFVLFWPQLIA